jgi:hypothetical protein
MRISEVAGATVICDDIGHLLYERGELLRFAMVTRAGQGEAQSDWQSLCKIVLRQR